MSKTDRVFIETLENLTINVLKSPEGRFVSGENELYWTIYKPLQYLHFLKNMEDERVMVKVRHTLFPFPVMIKSRQIGLNYIVNGAL